MNAEKQKILHIDMDAFFASVEQRDNPQLKGKPIAVGGDKSRGVVAAASYEARKFGVKSAMASSKAHQLCPDIIFVKPNFEQYKLASQGIRVIFERYTKLIEPLSLDEAFLDVTVLPKGYSNAIEVANAIRRDIEKELNLTASAGVSYNKFLAKMASDINKPNGLFEILPEATDAFLKNLRIEAFFGIGKVTAAKFKKLGVFFGSDLQRLSLPQLSQHFGNQAQHYFNLARGIDHRKVQPNRIRKTIGAERTFSNNIYSVKQANVELEKIVTEVHKRLEKSNKSARTITLKIKYTDFKQITRSITLYQPTQAKSVIKTNAAFLLQQISNWELGVRLLGISLGNLDKQETKKGEFIQLSFDF